MRGEDYHFAPVSPFLRIPLTDLTARIVSHQWFGRCQFFELRMVECMEAYGLERGMRECEALLKDFKECQTRHQQGLRTLAMRCERHRQHWTGERKRKYVDPLAYDSY